MKKVMMLTLCLSMTLVMLATCAFADEQWDPTLRGAAEGLAAGAMAPPGLYFINNFYFTPAWYKYGPSGSNPNIKLYTFVDSPVLFWSTGWQFLGAQYGAAIAQPFEYTLLRVKKDTGSAFNTMSGAQWGTFNTILVPVILSWKVGDFHISGAMRVDLNDGTTSTGDSLAAITKNGKQVLVSPDGKNIYAWTGNDAYIFTPVLGISWLHAGWNISAQFRYSWFTKNNDTDYQSGDEFGADYTVTYTCGRWTLGVGAEQENQLFNDKFNAGHGYRSQPNTMHVNYAMGPIIGYNFGPCSLMFYYNFAIKTKNEVGGDFFNLRLVVPLGNPLAGK